MVKVSRLSGRHGEVTKSALSDGTRVISFDHICSNTGSHFNVMC